MPSVPPNPDVQRFLAALNAFSDFGQESRLGLCVSGGPDSLALLLLAQAAGLSIKVATVDHQLRPTSGAEAAIVGGVCAEMGIEHATLRLETIPEGNISDWARTQRYRILKSWAQENQLDLLVTAHHADDQLETILMRLNRGSGVAGLAGVRSQQGQVIRPLLGWRKSELETIVAASGLVPSIDASNTDARYDRARLRRHLSAIDWLDPMAAVQSSRALAEAEIALEWAARQQMTNRARMTGASLEFDPSALPDELLRRSTLLCLAAINPHSAPRGREVDRLILALKDNKTATLAGVKAVGGGMWRFSVAPARRKTSTE
jgi:tRNA(Ile)-lysidine synthase